jgi:copper(I)-binding protein
MAAEPAFAVTPRIATVNIATANANRDGTGTVATLITGASTGTRIAEIVIKARVTTTAGQVRVFLHDGTNFFAFDEIAVAAAAVSSTVQGARVSTTYSNLVLPNASWSVRVSTDKAESIDVTALGADL